MDYEKKYKEVLERARIWQKHLYDTNDRDYADELNYIFPELAEPEDEKIRNGIIKYLSYIKDRDGSYMPNNIPFDDMLAWLEKQGQTFTKKDVDDAYLKGVSDTKHELEKQGEQKPAAWSEEDDMMIEETLYFLREYQQSNRCKDESGMQNSVTCEKWLKSLKERINGKQ